MALTLCGIDVLAFKNRPTSEELAEVLAQMPALKQANFFEHLAYALRNRLGYPNGLKMYTDAIAFGLTEENESAGVELLEQIIAAVGRVRDDLRVNEIRVGGKS